MPGSNPTATRRREASSIQSEDRAYGGRAKATSASLTQHCCTHSPLIHPGALAALVVSEKKD